MNLLHFLLIVILVALIIIILTLLQKIKRLENDDSSAAEVRRLQEENQALQDKIRQLEEQVRQLEEAAATSTTVDAAQLSHWREEVEQQIGYSESTLNNMTEDDPLYFNTSFGYAKWLGMKELLANLGLW